MKIEMGWAYGYAWGTGWCMRGLVDMPEGKRPLGRPWCKAKDNIKMDLKWDWQAQTGLIWLRMGTGCGLLQMRS
jgi:hypothetical protein